MQNPNLSCLRTWSKTVRDFFDALDVLADKRDIVFRPTMTPFDGMAAGTMIMFVERGPDGNARCMEELYSPCDCATLAKLVRAYQNRRRAYRLANNASALFAFCKSSRRRDDRLPATVSTT